MAVGTHRWTPLVKDPALLKPPKEGEGWAHGTLFQARALPPPIISSCKAFSTHQPPTEITDPQLSPTALIQDEAGPLPHHTHTPSPPATPPLSQGGGEAACFSGSCGSKWGDGQEDTAPTPGLPAELGRKGGEISKAPRLPLSVLFRPLCVSRPRLQFLPPSLSLSLSGCSSPHAQSTPGSSHQITQPQQPGPLPAAPPCPLPSSSPASSTL